MFGNDFGWPGFWGDGRVGLGQVPGPGGVGTLRPWVTPCGFRGSGFGVGTAIIAIAILILVALGVIF